MKISRKMKRIFAAALVALSALMIGLQVWRMEKLQYGTLLISGEIPEDASVRLEKFLETDALCESYASYSDFEDAMLQDGKQRRTVTGEVVHVKGDYTLPVPCRMLCGSMPANGETGRAVISAMQAGRLFATYDCVGETVLVNGEKYEVAGVYKAKGLAAALTLAGEDLCFLSAEESQTHYSVKVVSGKENQREVKLADVLDTEQNTGISIVFLSRKKEQIRFIVRLEIALLFLVIAWKIRKAFRQKARQPGWMSMISAGLILAAVFALAAALMTYPPDPKWIPREISAEAISGKALLWLRHLNEATERFSFENCFLQWAWRIILLCSVVFWAGVHCLIREREGRKEHA